MKPPGIPIASDSASIAEPPVSEDIPTMKVEAEQLPPLEEDLLTCGVCYKQFALGDILKFIQHKINKCNKENCRKVMNGDSGPVSPSPQSLKRPREETPVSPQAQAHRHISDSGIAKCSLVDADTNTTPNEPSNYTCFTCKQDFPSAWTLVQHAQASHGIKIYSAADSPPSLVASGGFPRFPRSASPSTGPLDLIKATAPLGLDTPDFYSQRLRQLAGASSPNAAIAALSNLSKPGASSPSDGRQGEQPRSSSPKSCFEGKALGIVRPQELKLRCNRCSFRCEKNSRLRKHIRSHHLGNDRDKERPGEGTSPASAKIPVEDNEVTESESEEDEEDEEDEDEEEEEEEEEEEVKPARRGREGSAAPVNGDVAQDLTVQRGPTSSSTPVPPPSITPPKTADVHSAAMAQMFAAASGFKKSLLGEVMEKIGLTNIQQYSEAYKQALEERPNSASSFVNGGSPHSVNSSITETNRSSSVGPGTATPKPPGIDFSMPPFDSPLYPDAKRVKLEASAQAEALYPGLWMPGLAGPRDLYNQISDPFSRQGKNDLLSVLPYGGTTLPRGPGTSGSMPFLGGTKPPRGEKRNDTCEFCGKVFKNCSNLTVHRRSHTGEKPYKCELCSYACAQSSKLTRHMKTHGRIGKDVYRCRFCDMPFSVPSTLEKHMRKCVVNASNAVSSPGLPPGLKYSLDDSKDLETWRKSLMAAAGAAHLVDSEKELSLFKQMSGGQANSSNNNTDVSMGGDSDSKDVAS